MTENAHTVENNPGRIDEFAGAEGDPDNDVVSSTHEAVRAISELPLAEQAAQFEALADQLRAERGRPLARDQEAILSRVNRSAGSARERVFSEVVLSRVNRREHWIVTKPGRRA